MARTERNEPGIGMFFVITGPSCAGKTTILEDLLRIPDTARLVTTTTRTPRAGEANGVDYHFVSREEFLRRRRAGEFLEWAQTYGDFYGSSSMELERLRRAHSAVFAILDVKGARTVKSIMGSRCKAIFIDPGGLHVVTRRLKERGGDATKISRRIKTAGEEMTHRDKFDFAVTNKNGRLDEAMAECRGIVMPYIVRRLEDE